MVIIIIIIIIIMIPTTLIIIYNSYSFSELIESSLAGYFLGTLWYSDAIGG